MHPLRNNIRGRANRSSSNPDGLIMVGSTATLDKVDSDGLSYDDIHDDLLDAMDIVLSYTKQGNPDRLSHLCLGTAALSTYTWWDESSVIGSYKELLQKLESYGYSSTSKSTTK